MVLVYEYYINHIVTVKLYDTQHCKFFVVYGVLIEYPCLHVKLV